MTKEEFYEIAKVLKGFYPNMTLTSDEYSLKVWHDELLPYTAVNVMDAVRQYGRANRYAPTVADIKELVSNNRRVVPRSECKECNGTGRVLVSIKNELTNRLYCGNDWAQDFCISCPSCRGWSYHPKEA